MPSDWAIRVLRDNGVKIKLVKCPGGVNPNKFNLSYSNKWKGNSPFKFLHIGKAEARKGTKLLLNAFNKAFGVNNPNVTLTLSIDNPHIENFDADKYIAQNAQVSSSFKTIRHISDIRTLYINHHASVFPTMAEGIGLPIVESIACGLPTIATRNSGTSEYLDLTTQYTLEKTKEIPVYDPHFFKNKGEFGVWDSPTEDELIERLREVYNNYQEATERAVYSSEQLLTKYTWAQAAKALE